MHNPLADLLYILILWPNILLECPSSRWQKYMEQGSHALSSGSVKQLNKNPITVFIYDGNI
jgi:hypothetical protein